MNTSPAQALTKIQAFALASRPKTLPAAAAPVILASAIAIYEHVFQAEIAGAALIAALFLQVGANFANDVFDFHRGADNEERLGPIRVTQAGLLSPQEVLWGMWISFGVAALLGLYLTWVAGWPILIIGLLAIAAAISYTGGPIPYGYYGLGDLFVFAFFGFAAVCGTYFAQAGTVSWLAFWGAIPMGALATAILTVNNLRDHETDLRAGKHTLVVRNGRDFARREYILLLIIAYLVPLYLVFLKGLTPWVLIVYISTGLLPGMLSSLYKDTGRPLNKLLAKTGRLELIYSLIFSLGLLIPKFL